MLMLKGVTFYFVHNCIFHTNTFYILHIWLNDFCILAYFEPPLWGPSKTGFTRVKSTDDEDSIIYCEGV